MSPVVVNMCRRRIPAILLFAFLFVLPSIAQTDLPNLSTATLSGSSSSASPSKSDSTPSSTDSSSASSTTDSNSASTTSASSLTVTSAPSLTSSNGASFFSITGSGPTVAGAGIPTMIVPDTSHAPFMQKSSLPEGTVFICVGAILGFLGFCVLAWRGLVAWSLHRSVQRAALKADIAESKAMMRPPGSGFYSSLPGGSALSLEPLGFTTGEKGSTGANNGGAGTGNERIGRPSQSHTPRSSLFFSPTAGAGLASPGNRTSQYLPAGYYAAGAAQTAGGHSTTHLGGSHGRRHSRHRSRGSLNATGSTPPDSPSLTPSLPPSRGTLSASQAARNSRRLSNPYSSPSGSALDLSAAGQGIGQRRSHIEARPNSGAISVGRAPEGRAPSAYLEDLFENHGNGPRERF